MEVTKDIFFEHETSILNDKWKIDLSYESSNAKSKKIELGGKIPIIEVVENGNFYSAIKIDVIEKNSSIKSLLLTGIDGAFILYPKTKNDNEGQSVIVKNDNLILSLGFTIISINLNSLKVNWKIRPDIAEIFEFYELENDILLRGEIGIHRIDFDGNIKWTFSARDIWINMDGKEEVKIEGNHIRLFDWESNEYLLDFNGEIIEDKPVKMENIPNRKWWQRKK
ncbi:hypothetical protein [Urechidicola croceus]|uniref:Uncharacterized protein n=1 Tax=Urechidicola croceus TaxID=1850246 RepID=A0A1D8P4C7_9FLAO|nr:hypothetical protein [Urechidicola croceus]AOW19361.1 hypothetical protein LPB138_01085 [Urechidicola croceus]